MNSKTIKVDVLARVEGEGALFVKIKDQHVADVKLRIFEPPRFFEALLRGRKCSEAPDITARICGICPVAYQMSACHAIEDAFGVRVEGPLRDLRRLLYCGEWIESHALHIYMLHAARLSRLRRRHPHGAVLPGHREARPALEKDRQRNHEAARRTRNPPDQRESRGILQGAHEAGTLRRWRKS